MLGFKLEVPKREGSTEEKIRPIYLDMQVRPESFSHLSVEILCRCKAHRTD